MNCKRAAEIIFLYIDENELGGDLDDLQAHLERCPPCQQRALFIRKLLVTFRQRCNRHPAPSELRQRILTSLPHRSLSAE